MNSFRKDALGKFLVTYWQELTALARRLPWIFLRLTPFLLFVLLSGGLLKACSNVIVLPPLRADRVWEMPADADHRALKNFSKHDRVYVWVDGPVKLAVRTSRKVYRRERKALETVVKQQLESRQEDRFQNLLGTGRLVRFYENDIGVAEGRVRWAGVFMAVLFILPVGICCFTLHLAIRKTLANAESGRSSGGRLS